MLLLFTVSLLYYDAYFGPGTGPVALAYTFCDGDEANLTECTSWKFPPLFFHYDDAGVKCYNTSGKYSMVSLVTHITSLSVLFLTHFKV